MDNLRKEDTVQAVLIADTYNDNFQPFSAESSPVSILSHINKRKVVMRISSFSVHVATREYADDRLCAGSTEQKQG